MEKKFFAVIKGEVAGPFSVQQVVGMIQSGELLMDGQCCRSGTEDWIPVKELWDSGELKEPTAAPSEPILPADVQPGKNIANRIGVWILLGLIAVISVLVWNGTKTTRKTSYNGPRWEYRVETFNNDANRFDDGEAKRLGNSEWYKMQLFRDGTVGGFSDYQITEKLWELGKEGWEMVGVAPAMETKYVEGKTINIRTGKIVVFFKRKF